MSCFHYLNDKFVAQEEALISVFDLSIIRGYAAFDYLPVYNGAPFHLEDHLKRLMHSAQGLHLAINHTLAQLIQITHELIKKNGTCNAGIRYIITAGRSDDFLLPKGNGSLIIIYHPKPATPLRYYETGLKVITSNILRQLSLFKTTNYLGAITAIKKAQNIGFDDAIYVNQKNELLEGTTFNLFFVKNGTLITNDSDEILKGITREIVLNLAQNIIPIELMPLKMEEIEKCEEAFITSSNKEIAPLVQIDDIAIGNGAPGIVTKKMQQLFKEYSHAYFQQNRASF